MTQRYSLKNDSWEKYRKDLKVETKVIEPTLPATQIMGLGVLITTLGSYRYTLVNLEKRIATSPMSKEEVLMEIKQLVDSYKSSNNKGVTYVAHSRITNENNYDTYFIDTNTLDVTHVNNLVANNMFNGQEECETDRIYNKFKVAPHFAYIFACLQNGFNGFYLTDDDIQEAIDKVKDKGISYEETTAYREDPAEQSMYYDTVIGINYPEAIPSERLFKSFESHVLHEIDLKFKVRKLKQTPRRSKAQINYFFMPNSYKKSVNLGIVTDHIEEHELEYYKEKTTQSEEDINVLSCIDKGSIEDVKVDFKTGEFSFRVNSQETSYNAILSCSVQRRDRKVFLDVLSSLKSGKPLVAWDATVQGNYNDESTAQILHETALWRLLVTQGIETMAYANKLPESILPGYESLTDTLLRTIEEEVLNNAYSPDGHGESLGWLPGITVSSVVKASIGADPNKRALGEVSPKLLSRFSDIGVNTINSILAYVVTQLDLIIYKYLISRTTQTLHEVNPSVLIRRLEDLVRSGVEWFMQSYSDSANRTIHKGFQTIDLNGYKETSKELLQKFLLREVELSYEIDQENVVYRVQRDAENQLPTSEYTKEFILQEAKESIQKVVTEQEDVVLADAYKLMVAVNEVAMLPIGIIRKIANNTSVGDYYFYRDIETAYGDNIANRLRSIGNSLNIRFSKVVNSAVSDLGVFSSVTAMRSLCLLILENGLTEPQEGRRVLISDVASSMKEVLSNQGANLPKPKKFRKYLYGQYTDLVQYTPDDLGKLILLGRLGVTGGVEAVIRLTQHTAFRVSNAPLKDIENDEVYVSEHLNELNTSPKDYYKLINEFAKEALKVKHEDTLLATLDGNFNSRLGFMDVLFTTCLLGVPMTQCMRLADYILYDCVHRQRAGEEMSTISLYEDYVEAVKVLVDNNYRQANNFNLTPMSLRLEHDIAVYERNKVREELESEELLKAYESTLAKRDVFKPLTSMKERSDKVYELVHPTSVDDLKQEGKDLSHCVGGYVSRIVEGNCLIFFLRDKEKLDKSYVTVEFKMNRLAKSDGGTITNYSLGQVLGRNNKPILNNTPLLEELRDRVKLLNRYDRYLEEKEEQRLERRKKKLEKQQALDLTAETVNN